MDGLKLVMQAMAAGMVLLFIVVFGLLLLPVVGVIWWGWPWWILPIEVVLLGIAFVLGAE